MATDHGTSPKMQDRDELTDAERDAFALEIARALAGDQDDPPADQQDESEAESAARRVREEQEEAAYERFKSEAGVSDLPPIDQRRVSEDALRVIERRRERIRQRLAKPPGGFLPELRRRKLEAELAELDALESQHWQVLHPPVIGSAFGGAGIRADQLSSPPRAFCRYCDRELSAEEAFAFSRVCLPCRVGFATAHDRPSSTE